MWTKSGRWCSGTSGTSSLYGLDSVLKPEAREQLPCAQDSRAGVGVYCRIHVRARQDLACLFKIKVWVVAAPIAWWSKMFSRDYVQLPIKVNEQLCVSYLWI